MGWSIDVIKDNLDVIFRNLDRQYTVQYVEAYNPTVMVKYEGDIPMAVMKTIAFLFPDFVYVQLIPNSTFPSGQPIAEKH